MSATEGNGKGDTEGACVDVDVGDWDADPDALWLDVPDWEDVEVELRESVDVCDLDALRVRDCVGD